MGRDVRAGEAAGAGGWAKESVRAKRVSKGRKRVVAYSTYIAYSI